MSTNTEPPKSVDLPSNTLSSQNSIQNPNDIIKNENNSETLKTTKNENIKSSSNQNSENVNTINTKNSNNNEILNEIEITKLDNNINMKEDKEINKDNNKSEDYEVNLKKRLNYLKELSNCELKKHCEEYYLIYREWMIKLNNYLKGENNVKLEDLKGKKDNDNFLLEKEIKKRALSLNPEEKEKMIILKPKNAFCSLYKPCPINKLFWEKINETFGLEPEVKEHALKIENEDGSFYYQRDYCKYVKINCIILPKKRNYKNDSNSYLCDYNNYNCSWPTPNNYIQELMKDIQNFYFFIQKDVSVKELLEMVENIVRKYPDIRLVEKGEYRCWIDTNFFVFENLLNLIKDRISILYNTYGLNTISPLELQKLEDEDCRDEIKGSEKFIFKLLPLKLFEKEELQDIFPNLFNNHFKNINTDLLKYINDNLKAREPSPEELDRLDKLECLTTFPELTIIIEQGINTLFYKDECKIKYKLGRCDNFRCDSKGILPISCECLKKYYCCVKCKSEDKIYHEDECQYSLVDYFITMSNQICKPIMKESSPGIKGIRNIGNTCYMNTALQCMSNCVELRNYFLFGKPRKDINRENVLGYKGLVAYGFEYLIKKLWMDTEPVIDLSKFKRAMGLCNERFGGRSQQDTHEFVTFLIDSLHEDLNRVNTKIYIQREERELCDKMKSKIEWNNYLRRNQSILVDLFYGLFKSTVSCSVCNKSCVDFNIFSSISVNLKNINKKQNTDETTNKEAKENKIEEKKDDNKMDIESNNNSEKEKENNNNKKEKMNSDENTNTTNDVSSKTEDIEMIESPKKKEELLVGGKPTNESDTLNDNKKTDNNSNEIFCKIPFIFFFYTLDEKPIQFMLPIRDKKELSHKYLIYKISKILNKDPFSLCLYHISGDRIIMNIYGKENFSFYEPDKLKNKILFASEISHETISNNIVNEINSIFYNAKIHKYHIAEKNTSREILEANLEKNRENIIKCINNAINDKDIQEENLDDIYLSNYYMNLDKVFQFTLKNMIFEENDKPKYIKYPKIIFLSKNSTRYDLYLEIFKINKKVILESLPDKNQKLKESFNIAFQKLLNPDNKTLNPAECIKEGPFFLNLQIFNKKNKKPENQKLLFLKESEKDIKIQDTITGMNFQQNSEDIQLIIEIYWNKIYNEKIESILRPEKIDKLIEKELEDNEKKQVVNESSYSTTKNDKGSNNENILKLQRERYNNLYEKYNTLNNLNGTPPNSNNQKENNINSNNINTKSDNSLPSTNPQSPAPVAFPQQNIINEMTLAETFEILGEEELLDENNEWYCENCKKKQRAKKKLEIYNTPKILIIQIKRFNHVNKINTKVDFPLKDLDLSKYIISSDSIDKNKSIKYDLFAVANHYGSLTYGHYTAFCKNSLNEKWYEYNDSSVCEISDLSRIVSSNAYVLFYRQKGLSKLNWNDIYKKQFIEIDINNPGTLVDYNDDFYKHMNDVVEPEENDINEYDKKIRQQILKIDENKNKENNPNIISPQTAINTNIKMNFSK